MKTRHTPTFERYKIIKMSSKNQIAIPKHFRDFFGGNDLYQAVLLDDGIFLKPIEVENKYYQDDIDTLIQGVLADGLQGEELLRELTKRAFEFSSCQTKKAKDIEEIDIDKVKLSKIVSKKGKRGRSNEEQLVVSL